MSVMLTGRLSTKKSIISCDILISKATTYYIPHLLTSPHYRTEVARVLLMSLKPLITKDSDGDERKIQSIEHTDKTPRVSSLVYLHAGCENVRSIAKIGQPHVFNVEVIECL